MKQFSLVIAMTLGLVGCSSQKELRCPDNGQANRDYVAPLLLDMHSEEVDVRRTAANRLVFVQDPRVRDCLEKAVQDQDEDRQVRMMAARYVAAAQGISLAEWFKLAAREPTHAQYLAAQSILADLQYLGFGFHAAAQHIPRTPWNETTAAEFSEAIGRCGVWFGEKDKELISSHFFDPDREHWPPSAPIPAAVYRERIEGMVLPQNDMHNVRHIWVKKHLDGAFPFVFETVKRHQDRPGAIKDIARLFLDMWEEGLLAAQQKREAIELIMPVGWAEMQETYPPGASIVATLEKRSILVMGGRGIRDGPFDMWPFGPGDLLKASIVAELDGRVLRSEQNTGLLRGSWAPISLPSDLAPGRHLLKASLEVAEQHGTWCHSWDVVATFEVDPALNAVQRDGVSR